MGPLMDDQQQINFGAVRWRSGGNSYHPQQRRPLKFFKPEALLQLLGQQERLSIQHIMLPLPIQPVRFPCRSYWRTDEPFMPREECDSVGGIHRALLHHRVEAPGPSTLNSDFDFSTLENIPTPPPKFSDKLSTNYIPNASEITEIKEYVNVVSEKLSGYDARIAELESALLSITAQRSQLAEIKKAHEALISPLRRLPPEILQMIFVYCLPSNRNAVMHVSEAPVLLGRVCSEWRRISLATPEVWSSLHIVPPSVNFTNSLLSTARFQKKRELVQMWLTRSGACPLSISFVWFAGDSEDEVKLCASLLEVLIPVCHRWKALDFQVPLKMFKPFLGLTVTDVPLLEGMSLMDNRTPLDTETVDHWPESLNFVESATRLRTFTLTFFSGGMRLPSIPWSQLTVLYLESNIAFFFVDSREMLSALSECAGLQNCTLKFPLSNTAPLPSYQKVDVSITLPELQVLCLDGDQHLFNTFHMSNTLMNLVAPKLRKLEVLGRSGRPDGNVVPEPLLAIQTLLARSKPPLERLSIESITILPEHFLACLRLAPNLVDLVVHNWALRMQVGPGVLGPAIGEDEQQTMVAFFDGGSTQGSRAVGPDIPENVILKALTLKHPVKDISRRPVREEDQGDIATQPSPELDSVVIQSPSLTPSPSFGYLDDDDDDALCPRLQRFDFTLCDASQMLFCDFIASRWKDVPDGVTKIRSVKCNFTSLEEDAATKRIDHFRSEGLVAFVTHQVPIMDDLNPSPWTGLEGQP